MRILKDNLPIVMKPFIKRKDGILCIKRGKVDDAINAILEAYGGEGCATVETNQFGRDYLVIYAADKNHLRKVQEYYIGIAKEEKNEKLKTQKKSKAKSSVEIHNEVMKSIKGENYEIIQHLGVLSESSKGWKKELNLISWHEKDAKYDIREWSPDHDRMGKGITFTAEELQKLKDILLDQ